jgi:hypothetical protein
LETLHEQADLVAAEAQVAGGGPEHGRCAEDLAVPAGGYRASSVTIKAAEAAGGGPGHMGGPSPSDDFEDDDPQEPRTAKPRGRGPIERPANEPVHRPSHRDPAGRPGCGGRAATAQLAEAQRAYEKVNDGPIGRSDQGRTAVAAGVAGQRSAEPDMAVIEAPSPAR